MVKIISRDQIDKGYTFKRYLDLVQNLVENNKTTGPDQSGEKVEMTRLNFQRLKRIQKTCRIPETLEAKIRSIDEPLTWVMLIEAWCGDGAQAMPYFAAVASLNPLIEFRLLLRDENPGLMDQFLTNGKRSIPKFICLDRDLNVLTTWGPRPAPAHEIYLNFRNNPKITRDDFHKELHLWYARDKGKAILDEMFEMFRNCCVNSLKEILV